MTSPPSSTMPRDTTSSFWHRVFLYNFTPAQSSVVVALTPELSVAEARPDPSLSPAAHFILGLLYFPSCVAFAAFVMYTWAIRAPVESFEVVSSSQFPPVEVSITLNCSNPPYCGNMSLVVNYSSGPSSSPCSALPVRLYTMGASPMGGVLGPITVPLCHVGPQVFTTHTKTPFFPIAGVQAEFSAVNPGLNSSQLPNSPAPDRLAYGIMTVRYGGNVLRVVTMDSWQVKTSIVGQTVTDDMTSSPPSKTVDLYPMGIQYDGKRSSWRSTCIVALASLTNHRSFARSSVLTILDSLGTSSYGSLILLMAFVWIIPVLRLLLPSPELVLLRQDLNSFSEQLQR